VWYVRFLGGCAVRREEEVKAKEKEKKVVVKKEFNMTLISPHGNSHPFR
jgi:hypothetical protein